MESTSSENQEFKSESNSPSCADSPTVPMHYNHLVATSQPRSDGPSEVWMHQRNEVMHEDRKRSYDGGREATTSTETETEKVSLSRSEV